MVQEGPKFSKRGHRSYQHSHWGVNIEAGDLQWSPRQPRGSQERSKQRQDGLRQRQDGLHELQDVLPEMSRWPKGAPKRAKIVEMGASGESKIPNEQSGSSNDEEREAPEKPRSI